MRVIGHITENSVPETCPHCRGTGQPNGIMGGPEHGVCSWCRGTGTTGFHTVTISAANLLQQYESAARMMEMVRKEIIEKYEAEGRKVTVIDDLIIVEDKN